jgi:hypothetical protein
MIRLTDHGEEKNKDENSTSVNNVTDMFRPERKSNRYKTFNSQGHDHPDDEDERSMFSLIHPYRRLTTSSLKRREIECIDTIYTSHCYVRSMIASFRYLDVDKPFPTLSTLDKVQAVTLIPSIRFNVPSQTIAPVSTIAKAIKYCV